MHFFTVREAGEAPYGASFRESKLIRTLIYLIIAYAVLLAVVLGGKGWFDLPGGDATRKGLALAIAALGVASVALAAALTFRSGNWVLRVIPKGVLVQLAEFGMRRKSGHRSVLFLEPREIEWVGPHDDDRRCLCIRLVVGSWREIEDVVAAAGGEDPQVRLLHERLLLIRWGGQRSWVLPGIDEAVEAVSRALEKRLIQEL
jgi:hypothetical protein